MHLEHRCGTVLVPWARALSLRIGLYHFARAFWGAWCGVIAREYGTEFTMTQQRPDIGGARGGWYRAVRNFEWRPTRYKLFVAISKKAQQSALFLLSI